MARGWCLFLLSLSIRHEGDADYAFTRGLYRLAAPARALRLHFDSCDRGKADDGLEAVGLLDSSRIHWPYTGCPTSGPRTQPCLELPGPRYETRAHVIDPPPLTRPTCTPHRSHPPARTTTCRSLGSSGLLLPGRPRLAPEAEGLLEGGQEARQQAALGLGGLRGLAGRDGRQEPAGEACYCCERAGADPGGGWRTEIEEWQGASNWHRAQLARACAPGVQCSRPCSPCPTWAGR